MPQTPPAESTPAPYAPAAFDYHAETDADGRDLGTVVAVHRDDSRAAALLHGCYEGWAGITARHPSAPSGPAVSWLAISPAYLDARCRPVTETEARAIHPALFEPIDRAEPVPASDLGTAAAALHLTAPGAA